MTDSTQGDGPRHTSGTGLVYDPRYLDHGMPPWHPERPERLSAIVEHLEAVGLLGQLVRIEPRAAAAAQIAEVHAPQHVMSVARLCEGGGGVLDYGDTPVVPASYEVALLAAGGLLAAVDAVAAGTVRNALCLVRPPGHHARPTASMGFCVFNNVAVAARHLQKRHGLGRVLIVDWDVHHGNGTQETFYEDPSVFYFSTHRHPFYPGSGRPSETGAGDGEGTTLNVPLPGGTGGERHVEVFEHVLVPAAEAFHPDFVLVSAGFDGHRDDPLGGMRLDDGDYGTLARIVRDIAERHCDGRLVATLEGGYNLDAQARSVAEVLRVFLAPEEA